MLRSQVLFLCAHFHAIMQERRTYIPQGWTKFYEFSSGDLASACETVSLLIDENESIDWQTLHGVLDSAVWAKTRNKRVFPEHSNFRAHFVFYY